MYTHWPLWVCSNGMTSTDDLANRYQVVSRARSKAGISLCACPPLAGTNETKNLPNTRRFFVSGNLLPAQHSLFRIFSQLLLLFGAFKIMLTQGSLSRFCLNLFPGIPSNIPAFSRDLSTFIKIF